MAELQNNINLNPLIHSTKEIQGGINRLSNQVDSLDGKMSSVEGAIQGIKADMNHLKKELKSLHDEFRAMVDDQQKAQNLQRAISELIRVRQEIDQKYGGYKTIRETMLGVLQATDAALVKKSTISQVSEELMLSTPQYWLAPCLVAVAAWISNDKELAERAIKEAQKRDAEKTAIAMALICRRNGRVETGYEWLSLYFEKQCATSFSEESFTYIDAYVNGVFGPDMHHSCQGYITKWIDEVRGTSSNFEASQVELWKGYCARYRKDIEEEYPDLAKVVPEYDRINKCIGGISSINEIKSEFKDIMDAFVDQDSMKRAVDTELVKLIGNYDSAEVDIRKEEEYLSLVKYYAGDEGKAKDEMRNREAKRLHRKIDFIEQMSSQITSGNDTTPSKKKTAVTFLGNYINMGANQYIAEPKADFPNEVTMNIGPWSGKSVDGNETMELTKDYEERMLKAKEEAIEYANNTMPLLLLIGSIVSIGLGVLSLFVSPILAVTLMLVGAFCLLYRIKVKNDLVKTIEKINRDYDQDIIDGKAQIVRTLAQWIKARRVVSSFNEEKDAKVVA